MLPPANHQAIQSQVVATDLCVTEPQSSLPQSQTSVLLSFRQLAAFEQVHNQFQRWGVRFQAAIALEPSNPIFPYQAGGRVLMPTGNQSSLTLTFDRAVRWVEVVVSSVQSVRVTALDADHQRLESSEQHQNQRSFSAYLGDVLPQQHIRVSAEGIARIVIDADAPFILSAIMFGA